MAEQFRFKKRFGKRRAVTLTRGPDSCWQSG
jgi:hypothetical protein